MEEMEKRKAAPPYVSYKTLSNFLARFKQGVPARIDRGLMGSMSGAAQSQVTTALRFLGMISDKGIPTPILHQYVSGDEPNRTTALVQSLRTSYPFIWQEPFDLRTGTAQLLREAFEENTSATGETLQRCIAFFKDAAIDARLDVSPYIMQKKARTPGNKKRAQTKRDEKVAERSAQQTAPPPHTPHPPSSPAQSSLLLSGLFLRLPKPGTAWSKDERERWIQTLQNVLLLEYPEL